MILKKVTAMVEFEKTKFHSHETHLDSDGHRPNLFVQDCKWSSVKEERPVSYTHLTLPTSDLV